MHCYYYYILLFSLFGEACYFFFIGEVLLFAFQAIEYEVGDVLEVLPSQDPAAVDTFIQRCNLDPDALITVNSTSAFRLISLNSSLHLDAFCCIDRSHHDSAVSVI